MEEQPTQHATQTLHSRSQSPNSQSYIVQVPVSHINRRPSSRSNQFSMFETEAHSNFSFTFLLLWIFFVLIIFSLIFFVIVGICFLILRPKNPRFSIEKINNIQNPQNSQVKYNISLRIKNRNPNIGTLYPKSGSALLSLNQQQIASGNFPNIYQGIKKSSIFNVLLCSENELPKEIKKEMVNYYNLPLSLLLNVEVNFKLWVVKTWNMKMVITCDTVSNQCHEQVVGP